MRNHAEQLTHELSESTRSTQGRLDSFTSITFTVLAVLFGALGLAATRTPELSFLTSSAPLAAIALFFALRSYYAVKGATDNPRRANLLWPEIIIAALLGAGLLIAQVLLGRMYSTDWATVKHSVEKAQTELELLKTQDPVSVKLQQQIEDLRQQINNLKDQSQKGSQNPAQSGKTAKR
jgi:hypothetical protein